MNTSKYIEKHTLKLVTISSPIYYFLLIVYNNIEKSSLQFYQVDF